MATRLSLKDQLAELDQPAPVDLDPEDALAGFLPSEHRLPIDHSAATDHYIDVAPSSLRKLHESVSDPKYDGVRTSRKHLYDDSDPSGSDHSGDDVDQSDLENDLSGPGGSDEEPSEGATEDEEELQSPSDDDISSEHASGSGSDSETSRVRPPAHRRRNGAAVKTPHLPAGRSGAPAGVPDGSREEGDIASNLRQTHEADKKKGRAVSRQIALWDTLLDARIQLQKAVTAANRLPLPGQVGQYVEHPSVRESLDSMFDVAGDLTEELFSLQEDLLRLNESIEGPARKRRKVTIEAAGPGSDAAAAALAELSAAASALGARYHPWAVDTLGKWSAKVQAVAPNVLLPDNRGSFLRDGKRAQAGVVELVDDLLRADGAKLLDRTRKRKDKHVRLGHVNAGSGDEEELDAEVFDDTDYYQQLLRDVIAGRGGGSGQGEAQWQTEQRERKAKRKKTVDTKASKGRKLRYEVHAKLQNFMVPVPVAGGDWHEEQIDGLFSSLLQS